MLILGISFGISESTANNIFHYWIDILQYLLPCSLFKQYREKKCVKSIEYLNYFFF
ncbi:MAG: transposase family protein [Trichodesmium sp. St16_bin4-tuft]|uniref:transposase family protein n=1 Tax=Trichodesmium erythraeum TaxID=1206 RepID=UPI000300F569|nr:transposase family protein [Trichodesmium erythraeum GBRTRLIN201]MCH2048179.1 transposase family protein [Trichodesmium sp. ALOHA_ZT_67]MCL2926957.1 transposase family protein [Trichodesmium sp. MAG_R01]MDE5071520.1 transposase family protein [Trichodesmium sp. St5_bin8]MDE5093071.1 transposase family protein [Trichodesmium sp. St11_bin5]MDE5100825.1 transposase family protein [Trichodesmium sp. St16_bin4-tuft]MDE5103214.1 transposase family protein [Trichodesmium sp. St19_bin2]MDT9339446